MSDGVRQQFTSKERDVETGLDYFLARYYSSVQGRFTSPENLRVGQSSYTILLVTQRRIQPSTLISQIHNL